MRKQAALKLALAGGAAGLFAYLALPPGPSPEGAIAAPPARQAASASPRPGPLAELPVRDAIGEARGPLFEPRSWAPPPPPQSRRTAEPQRPTAPPVPYRIAGQVVHEGAAQVVLSREDRVFTVRLGELVGDDYRVESITPESVTLVYLPLGLPQVLYVSGALRLEPQPSPTAQLR